MLTKIQAFEYFTFWEKQSQNDGFGLNQLSYIGMFAKIIILLSLAIKDEENGTLLQAM